MNIRLFPALLVACLAPVSVMASIDGVSVSPNQVHAGEEIIVTVSGNTTTQNRCGLTVEFGDGDVRDIKIETKEGLFPRTLTKVYAKPGAYAILVTGKSIFRGLNSFSACEGKATTAVTVADAMSRSAISGNANVGRNLVVKESVGKRIALVIGNGGYQYPDSLPKLSNPTHDAEDIAKALRGFGFEVIEKKDMSLEGMNDAITEFGRRIVDSEAALFYFAGHGLQVKGQNYLIPINAKIESEAQVPFQSININQLLEEMENGKSRANIVILDACRNNPISGKFRSGATRGLAVPSSQPKGTVIVYATDPGNVAADGSGRNGLFTAGLLAAFKGSDLSLRGVLLRASKEVERGSGQKQTPYINGPATLQEDFKFAPGQQVVIQESVLPVARIKSSEEIEQEGWESARDSGSIEVVQEYLRQYPKGRFAGQAKIHLASLKAAAVKAEAARVKAEQDAQAAAKAEAARQKSAQDAKAANAARLEAETNAARSQTREKESTASLYGTWYSATVTTTFNTDGTLVSNGQRYYYTAKDNVILLVGQEGLISIPYQLSGGTLTVTLNGETTVFTRKPVAINNTGNSRPGGISSELLLSSAWCSSSYNAKTGSTNSSRVQLRADGTYSSGGQHEGYSSGYAGTFASQSNSQGGGRWQVSNGELYMSEGNGNMELVNTHIERNNYGYIFIVANGVEFRQCK